MHFSCLLVILDLNAALDRRRLAERTFTVDFESWERKIQKFLACGSSADQGLSGELFGLAFNSKIKFSWNNFDQLIIFMCSQDWPNCGISGRINNN